ncbi:hypothetical protein RUMHYD_02158 [Blautia hydrogenotrophica DSM 10507]|uniref:Uncharacterized protein n=1 Tax=Blautia hydrogenotrophica (strain DSM 10507 / JCM 14656 / S5a33) TaxID=476272 RepID=C0CMS1_BLAHS|nr:hypothetical protein RUMHYD_02158 [Blautia hydrogenotrophica DSM 10507]
MRVYSFNHFISPYILYFLSTKGQGCNIVSVYHERRLLTSFSCLLIIVTMTNQARVSEKQ